MTNYPKVIENISDDMYVDDLTFEGNTVREGEILKQKCKELYKEGGFNLHKWHCNIPSLENTKTTNSQVSLLMQSKCFKPVQVKLKY